MAAATGSLVTTPLPHVLVYARNRRLTGILELTAGSSEAPPSSARGSSGPPPSRRDRTRTERGVVSFWRGRVTDARTTPVVDHLGAVLYELGYVDLATMNETLLELAKTGKRHGEILVERGVLTAAQRDEALVEQTCRRVHALFGLPRASSFAFYDAAPSKDAPALILDPMAPTWRGIREEPPRAQIEEVLERVRNAAFQLINEAPLGAIGFTGEEANLCKALTARPLTLAEMRALTSLDERRVELFAYLLLIGKCIEPIAPAQARPSTSSIRAARPSSHVMRAAPPVSSSSALPAQPGSSPSLPISQSRPTLPISTPAPPPSARELTPTPPSARELTPTPRSAQALRDTGISAPPPGYPSMSFKVSPPVQVTVSVPPPASGTNPTSSPEELGAAGIAARAAAVDEEDYFQALGLDDGASVEAVRAAYFQLAKLWHPDRLPRALEGSREGVEKIFAHLTRAQRTLTDDDARRGWLTTRNARSAGPQRSRGDVVGDIELALQRRNFAFAEDEARKLSELDSEDAEAQALLAWAMARAGEAPEDVLRAAIIALDKAITNDRYCERAFYYRGMVSKKLGNVIAAFRDFSRTVQLNPKHVDAEREVRLMEMRARRGSGEHALGDLLARVRSKK